MNKHMIPVCVLLFCLPSLVNGEEPEGNYLYKVTTIRAATGAVLKA